MLKVPEKPIEMSPVNVTSDLTIENYDELMGEAEYIEKHYQGFIGSEKQCRQLKRKINKLNRALNNLRKAKAKPYRDMLKQFKGQIDGLRNHINIVKDAMDKQLDMYKKNQIDDMRDEFQPIWDDYCNDAGMPVTDVPDDIFAKKSMSKKQRLEKLAEDAKGAEFQYKVQHAHDLHGKAVNINKNTGEIKPLKNVSVHHLTFIGTNLQYLSLLEYAKKNGIKLSDKK